MSTAVTDVQAEAPCEHLNRTPSSNPNREVCDDCKQIFQDGVPVSKIGQQLSGLAPEAEVPLVTKAAASRAKKARKPKVGKAVGAENINLSAEEKVRGKQADEEKARQEYIKGVSADATYVINEFASYIPLYKAAQEAVEARDTFKKTLQENPKFAKKVQNIRDFFSTKKNNEFLTVNGHDYKSIKPLFVEELKVTYEYVRSLGSRFGRLDLLLTPAQELKARQDAAKAKREAKAAEDTATQQPTETEIQVPAQEAVQEAVPEINLHSVAERVHSAFSHTLRCTQFLSPAEKDEFYSTLISRLQDEMQPPIDIDPVFTAVTEDVLQ
jgi:hypothetical protein